LPWQHVLRRRLQIYNLFKFFISSSLAPLSNARSTANVVSIRSEQHYWTGPDLAAIAT
jgi:hypothetical protein